MDFGALPPEVNSGRMYCGPGSAPMVAAASAWNGLAAELSVAAVGYERVITTLQTEEWLGPASTLMVEAVAPYVAWMRATAIKLSRQPVRRVRRRPLTKPRLPPLCPAADRGQSRAAHVAGHA